MMELRNGTMFIHLPENLHRPVNGGCDCPYCKAHPHNVPMWDTLAHATEKDGDHVWTVHYPELKLKK